MKRRILLLGLALGLMLGYRPATPVQAQAHYHLPTVLIHGFRAGPHTFDRLIQTARRDRGQLTLTAYIGHGRVTYQGHWSPAVAHPLIKVVYLDNHASWAANARGLNLMLRQLKHRYHLKAFDAVAHSRGNLDLLVAYGHAQPLTLRRAVLVAPPANGKIRLNDPLGQNRLLPDGLPRYRHPQYRDLVRLRRHFPKDTTHVLSVIGNIGNGSDGVLTNVSSRSLYPALGRRFASFKQVIVHGPDASHHWIIRRDRRVIHLALNFLWAHPTRS